jgi:hypothetical protein
MRGAMVIARGNNRESKMYLVDIRMQPGDLSRQMSAMRMWLDEHRFEPTTFSCRDADCGMLVSVEFKISDEAAAFAERFDGRANAPLGANAGEKPASEILEAGLSPHSLVG